MATPKLGEGAGESDKYGSGGGDCEIRRGSITSEKNPLAILALIRSSTDKIEGARPINGTSFVQPTVFS
ncbi:hypothetical protein GBA52_009732 [Prunus armeniaca]|nr:hypothetical protein GBA52_009732 [Prunus armeniaca]